MAVVFRAHDERLDRQVALKLLAPGLAADQAFRQRFIRESRAAAAVDDPHIIPVFEAGEAAGVLFIAMRYVRGGDVRSLLDGAGHLPAARVVEIISAGFHGARRRPRARSRAPGRQAREHAARLLRGQRQAGPRVPVGLRAQQGHAVGERPDAAPDRSSAPSTTSRLSRSRASRSTGARTSTRWPAPPSNCSRGRRRSAREEAMAVIWAQVSAAGARGDQPAARPAVRGRRGARQGAGQGARRPVANLP